MSLRSIFSIGAAVLFFTACAAERWVPMADEAAVASASKNLIDDSSFESPTIAGGQYGTFKPGARIGPWKVVGVKGDVALVSGSYAVNGYVFTPGCGHQSLDISDSGAKTAVEQTIGAMAGKHTLSFKVGNIYNPGTFFGKSSTIEVLVNGKPIFRAVNTHGKGSKRQVWQSFTTTFSVASPSTTIEFRNEDPKGDLVNGLDCIVAR